MQSYSWLDPSHCQSAKTKKGLLLFFSFCFFSFIFHFGFKIFKNISVRYWMTIEIMEQKLQWPHLSRNNRFMQKIVQKSYITDSCRPQEMTSTPLERGDSDFQSYHIIIFRMSHLHHHVQSASLHAQKHEVWRTYRTKVNNIHP